MMQILGIHKLGYISCKALAGDPSDMAERVA